MVESPRLLALLKEAQIDKHRVSERFWREVKGKAPLIEPVPGGDTALLLMLVTIAIPARRRSVKESRLRLTKAPCPSGAKHYDGHVESLST